MEDMAVFKGYLRSLMRQLKQLKKSIKEENIEEAEPFEASDALESDLDAEAWNELYSQYLGE